MGYSYDQIRILQKAYNLDHLSSDVFSKAMIAQTGDKEMWEAGLGTSFGKAVKGLFHAKDEMIQDSGLPEAFTGAAVNLGLGPTAQAAFHSAPGMLLDVGLASAAAAGAVAAAPATASAATLGAIGTGVTGATFGALSAGQHYKDTNSIPGSIAAGIGMGLVPLAGGMAGRGALSLAERMGMQVPISQGLTMAETMAGKLAPGARGTANEAASLLEGVPMSNYMQGGQLLSRGAQSVESLGHNLGSMAAMQLSGGVTAGIDANVIEGKSLGDSIKAGFDATVDPESLMLNAITQVGFMLPGLHKTLSSTPDAKFYNQYGKTLKDYMETRYGTEVPGLARGRAEAPGSFNLTEIGHKDVATLARERAREERQAAARAADDGFRSPLAFEPEPLHEFAIQPPKDFRVVAQIGQRSEKVPVFDSRETAPLRNQEEATTVLREAELLKPSEHASERASGLTPEQRLEILRSSSASTELKLEVVAPTLNVHPVKVAETVTESAQRTGNSTESVDVLTRMAKKKAEREGLTPSEVQRLDMNEMLDRFQKREREDDPKRHAEEMKLVSDKTKLMGDRAVKALDVWAEWVEVGNREGGLEELSKRLGKLIRPESTWDSETNAGLWSVSGFDGGVPTVRQAGDKGKTHVFDAQEKADVWAEHMNANEKDGRSWEVRETGKGSGKFHVVAKNKMLATMSDEIADRAAMPTDVGDPVEQIIAVDAAKDLDAAFRMIAPLESLQGIGPFAKLNEAEFNTFMQAFANHVAQQGLNGEEMMKAVPKFLEEWTNKRVVETHKFAIDPLPPYPKTGEAYSSLDDSTTNSSVLFSHERAGEGEGGVSREHIWLDSVKTPEESRLRGGALRLIERLKSMAQTNQLPIYAFAVNDASAALFKKAGFKTDGAFTYYEPSKANMMELGDKPLFMTATEKMFSPGEVEKLPRSKSGGLFYDLVKARFKLLPKVEQELLPGFLDWVDSTAKAQSGQIRPEQIVEYARENGPQVNVHTYGMEGTVSPAKIEFDQMTHEWHDVAPIEIRNLVHNYDVYTITDLYPDYTAKLNALSPEERAKVDRYVALKKQVRSEALNKKSGPQATHYYKNISPYDTKTYPVVRIDVVLPTPGPYKAQFDEFGIPVSPRSLGYLWKEDGIHEQLHNTLGWAMVQFVPGPDGKTVMFVAEQQSRWGQDQQRLERTAKDEGLTKEQFDAKHRLEPSGHPLLPVQHNLVLKAVIDEARKRDMDQIVISDGTTAMMTEGHDKQGEVFRITPTEVGIESVKKHNEGKTRVAHTDYIDILLSGKAYETTSQSVVGWAKVHGFQTENIGLKQAGGMRLHYDTTLPSAMRALTGDKGREVVMPGVHKQAVQTANLSGVPLSDWDLPQHQTKIGSQVFRDPSGNPETRIVGRLYDLSKVLERRAAGESFTLGGKNYMLVGDKANLTPEQLAVKRSAMQMDAAGVDPKRVTLLTGWFKAASDGEWRFQTSDRYLEIRPDLRPTGTKDWLTMRELDQIFTDNKGDNNAPAVKEAVARVNDQNSRSITLPDGITVGAFLVHPELLTMYPFLRDIPVKRLLDHPKQKFQGYYEEGRPDPAHGGLIGLKEKMPYSQFVDVLVHEIQHYIQGVENWARGGNELTKRSWLKFDIGRRLNETREAKAIADWQLQNKEVVAKYHRVTAYFKRGQVPERVYKAAVRNYQKFEDRLEKLTDAFERVRLSDAFTPKDPTSTEGVQFYKKIAGEIEAVMAADSRYSDDVDIEQDRMKGAGAFALADPKTFKGSLVYKGDDSKEWGVMGSMISRHAELEARKDSLTPEETAEAQELVDAAANAAGFTVKAHRGESERFNVYKESKLGSTLGGPFKKAGFFFAPSRNEAGMYANSRGSDVIVDAYLKLNNPKVLSYEEWYSIMNWGNLPGQLSKSKAAEKAKNIIADARNNNDGIVILSRRTNAAGEYVVFEPNQIKSADPFTGVPLSERFNLTNPNIYHNNQLFRQRKVTPKIAVENMLLHALEMNGHTSERAKAMARAILQQFDHNDIKFGLLNDPKALGMQQTNADGSQNVWFNVVNNIMKDRHAFMFTMAHEVNGHGLIETFKLARERLAADPKADIKQEFGLSREHFEAVKSFYDMMADESAESRGHLVREFVSLLPVEARDAVQQLLVRPGARSHEEAMADMQATMSYLIASDYVNGRSTGKLARLIELLPTPIAKMFAALAEWSRKFFSSLRAVQVGRASHVVDGYVDPVKQGILDDYISSLNSILRVDARNNKAAVEALRYSDFVTPGAIGLKLAGPEVNLFLKRNMMESPAVERAVQILGLLPEDSADPTKVGFVRRHAGLVSTLPVLYPKYGEVVHEHSQNEHKRNIVMEEIFAEIGQHRKGMSYVADKNAPPQIVERNLDLADVRDKLMRLVQERMKKNPGMTVAQLVAAGDADALKLLDRLNKPQQQLVLDAVLGSEKAHMVAVKHMKSLQDDIARGQFAILLKTIDRSLTVEQAKQRAKQFHEAWANGTLGVLSTGYPDVDAAMIKYFDRVRKIHEEWQTRRGYISEQRVGDFRYRLYFKDGTKSLDSALSELQMKQNIEVHKLNPELDKVEILGKESRDLRFQRQDLEALAEVEGEHMDLLKRSIEQLSLAHPELTPEVIKIITGLVDKSSTVAAQIASMDANTLDMRSPKGRRLAPGRENLDMFAQQIMFFERVIKGLTKKLTRVNYDLAMRDEDMINHPAREMMDQAMENLFRPDPEAVHIVQNMNWFKGLFGNWFNMIQDASQPMTGLLRAVLVGKGVPVLQAEKFIWRAGKDLLPTGSLTGERADVVKWFKKGNVGLASTETPMNNDALMSIQERRVLMGYESSSLIKDSIGKPTFWLLQKSKDIAKIATDYGETTTFLASFDAFRAQGMTYEQARDAAFRNTKEVNSSSGKSGRSVTMWNNPDLRPIAAMVNGLQNFSNGVIGILSAHLQRGFFSYGPESTQFRKTLSNILGHTGELSKSERVQARKAFVIGMGTMLAVAGALGIPGVGIALKTMEALGWNAKEDLMKVLTSGEDPDNSVFNLIALHGMGSLLGFDVGAKMGVGGMLGLNPFNGFDAGNLFGVTGGMIKSAGLSVVDLLHGEVGSAVERMAPNVLQRPLKLYRDGWEFRDMDGTKMIESDNMERTMYGVFGIKPKKLMDLEELRRIQRADRDIRKQSNVMWVDAQAQVLESGDVMKVKEAIAERVSQDPGLQPDALMELIAQQYVDRTMPYNPALEPGARSPLMAMLPGGRGRGDNVEREQTANHVKLMLGGELPAYLRPKKPAGVRKVEEARKRAEKNNLIMQMLGGQMPGYMGERVPTRGAQTTTPRNSLERATLFDQMLEANPRQSISDISALLNH